MQLLLLIFISFNAYASLPELFGSSALNSALGGQAVLRGAGNNYYAPSLQGYSNQSLFSFDYFAVQTNFFDINNVTTKNQTNTVNTSEVGDVEVNPPIIQMMMANLSIPLFSPDELKLNLTFWGPIDRLLESDSGEPYRPTYIQYRQRLLRPGFMASIANDWKNWAWSLGFHTGFQTGGETYFMTRTTAGNPSLARANFTAKPSIGGILSLALKNGGHISYFTFQQEMKSRLENNATGETEIASNTSFQFNFDVNSNLYYDPMTLRIGHMLELTTVDAFGSLEFQQWDRFESSMIELKQRGGTINGSENYEKLSLRNIIIPKLGISKKVDEKWTLLTGYSFRPSPLRKTSLSEAGNSLDADKHILSFGTQRMIELGGKKMSVDLTWQGHFLRSFSVKKSPLREDGDPSEPKIGSPGYKVGGNIQTIALGLNWKY